MYVTYAKLLIFVSPPDETSIIVSKDVLYGDIYENNEE